MPGPGACDLMYRSGLARIFWSRVGRPEIRCLVEVEPIPREGASFVATFLLAQRG